jgi:hypothetical protein
VATAGLVLLPTAADAATACDDPDTTWVGPAAEDGSGAWNEPSNWTAGVPTATSVVCIPATPVGPHVAMNSQSVAGTVDASAAVLTLEGAGFLTVTTARTVGSLVGDGGTLVGPGATTVTGSLIGELTFQGTAVDQWGDASVGRWWNLEEGSTLTVHGDVELLPGADVSSYTYGPGEPGLLVVAETGSLTVGSPDVSASIRGGFANHGTVSVTAGHLQMFGTRGEGRADEYSTGLFSAASGATLEVAATELRTGTHFENVQADSFLVPADNVIDVADSRLVDWEWGTPTPGPSMGGAGEIVVTDGTWIGARIQDSLTVTVPEGEVLDFGGAVEDHARLVVDGEVHERATAVVEDGMIDVRGTYVSTGGTNWGGLQLDLTDLGTFLIEPGATFVKEGPDFGVPFAEMENHGSVVVDEGDLGVHLSGAAQPSTGDFSAKAGTSLFVYDVRGAGASMALGAGATVTGRVTLVEDLAADGVTFDDADVRTHFDMWNGVDKGSLTLTGTTTLRDGTSLKGQGPISVQGDLESDPGEGGATTLAGADVAGSVSAVSGTLDVPNLAPVTLHDGVLTGGSWSVAPGATLDLPEVVTNKAALSLEGAGASFGDGLSSLVRNAGTLAVASDARLRVDGAYRQTAAGTLEIGVGAAGSGRLVTAGQRDLAGDLVLVRDPDFRPAVGTLRTVVTSHGRVGAGDHFDQVVYTSFGGRGFRAEYDVDRVRVRVVRR